MSDRAQRPADRDAEPRRRRWIRVTLVVLAIIALVVVAVMLLGGGSHGPWRHTAPAASEHVVTEHISSEAVRR
jgi:ferric-dicitrate binding protein FerR (iron transport regulator)